MLTLSLPRPTPPAVGSVAPPFELPDPATGKTVALSYFVGQDTLVVFLRGTWCPFCRDQLLFLSQNQERLEGAGIAVVAIACQSANAIKAYLDAHPLPFPLLADARRDAAKAYGVHYAFSPEGINLAHPSLFILDQSGRIAFQHVGRSMRDLPLDVVLNRFLSLLDPTRRMGTSDAAWQGTFTMPGPSNG